MPMNRRRILTGRVSIPARGTVDGMTCSTRNIFKIHLVLHCQLPVLGQLVHGQEA